MKTINLLIYYSFIISPFFLLIQAGKSQIIEPTTFFSLLLGYALLYHPFISVLRLHLIGKIAKKDMLSYMIPYKYMRFAKDLYMG